MVVPTEACCCSLAGFWLVVGVQPESICAGLNLSAVFLICVFKKNQCTKLIYTLVWQFYSGLAFHVKWVLFLVCYDGSWGSQWRLRLEISVIRLLLISHPDSRALTVWCWSTRRLFSCSTSVKCFNQKHQNDVKRLRQMSWCCSVIRVDESKVESGSSLSLLGFISSTFSKWINQFAGDIHN